MVIFYVLVFQFFNFKAPFKGVLKLINLRNFFIFMLKLSVKRSLFFLIKINDNYY